MELITATGLRIINYFNFSSPETTKPQSHSKQSTSPCNKTQLKPHKSQVPSIRSFHPNELDACIKIQKTTRDYLKRRTLAAINWTNDQLLKDSSLTNTFFENEDHLKPHLRFKIGKKEIVFENEDHRKPTLLFKIAKKEIVIPNELSLNHVMKHLIQDKEDLNIRDEDGNTPLHWASETGNLEVVKCLIENKANLEAKGRAGYTPLHLATINGHPEIAKVLIEKGVDLNAKGLFDNTPLHLAIIINYPNPEIAKVLIENGADLNTIDDNNYTPFQCAVIRGDLEMVKLLIDHGADLNAKESRYDYTPLHIAAKYGYSEIAKVLIEKGADLNAKGKFDDTPLHLAIKDGHLDIAKQLKIIDHLDNNDSIDSLTSNIKNLTADQIKSYYKIHQKEIDSLMNKRAENLLKKAITELNKDISLAIIKRGKSFLENQLNIRSLRELCAIKLQHFFEINEHDPNYIGLKTYPEYIQEIFFNSYEPRLNLTDKQINHARYLLNVLNDNIRQANINYSNQATTNICDLGHH